MGKILGRHIGFSQLGGLAFGARILGMLPPEG
jgi:hypothetical protein